MNNQRVKYQRRFRSPTQQIKQVNPLCHCVLLVEFLLVNTQKNQHKDVDSQLMTWVDSMSIHVYEYS